jgi:glycosyltransferase involved in cell wall biosynthesis
MKTKPTICLIGHPFAPIGRGEDIRSAFRAFQAVGQRVSVADVHRFISPNSLQKEEFGRSLTNRPGDVNIFFLNGDELSAAMNSPLFDRKPGVVNIAFPAWELPRFPAVWAELLAQFDEVWAQSRFTESALRGVVQTPLTYISQPCQVLSPQSFSRRYFGLPEAPFIFVFAFDLRSYVARKNPQALLDAFESLARKFTKQQVHLCLKVHGLTGHEFQQSEFAKRCKELHGYVTVIDKVLSDEEHKGLLFACDSFVSLHRSEGFGRGMGEAMCLGKPVISTGYSGNLDFMNEQNSHLVPYTLVDVPPGDYPHGEQQQWAQPSSGAAADKMHTVVADLVGARKLGVRGAQTMARDFSFLAIGLRMAQRVAQLSS